MLKSLSIKSLYVLALAEGEGVGTAYEYFAKRLVLARWLKSCPKPQRLLVAGLPERYGSSLDFLQVTQEFGATVTIIDERPSALEKLQRSLTAAQREGWLTAVSPQPIPVHHLADLREIAPEFDLCLASEVLQRLEPTARAEYISHLRRLATNIALFAPNGGNAAHTNISGLSGVTLTEMRQLAETTRCGNARHWNSGHWLYRHAAISTRYYPQRTRNVSRPPAAQPKPLPCGGWASTRAWNMSCQRPFARNSPTSFTLS